MTNRDDERYRKAEAAIMESFVTLLADNGFAAITVKGLIARAGVNRSTFYAHYADKADLLDHIENRLLNELAALVGQAPVREHAGAGAEPTSQVRAYFTRLAGFLEDNGVLFGLLLGERGRPEFALKLNRMIHDTWSARGLTALASVPIGYAYAVFAGVTVNLISEWVTSGFQQTSDEFVAIALHITQGLPGRLFDLRNGSTPTPQGPGKVAF